MRCEHAFVSIKGSPYAYFRRTLETRNLAIVPAAAAAELAHIGLSDGLAILELMARDGDPRFEKAAARAGSAGYSPRHRP